MTTVVLVEQHSRYEVSSGFVRVHSVSRSGRYPPSPGLFEYNPCIEGRPAGDVCSAESDASSYAGGLTCTDVSKEHDVDSRRKATTYGQVGEVRRLHPIHWLWKARCASDGVRGRSVTGASAFHFHGRGRRRAGRKVPSYPTSFE